MSNSAGVYYYNKHCLQTNIVHIMFSLDTRHGNYLQTWTCIHSPLENVGKGVHPCEFSFQKFCHKDEYENIKL
jgi:hypothetical protein